MSLKKKQPQIDYEFTITCKQQIYGNRNPVPCLFNQLSFNKLGVFNYTFDGYKASYPEKFYLANSSSLNHSNLNRFQT